MKSQQCNHCDYKFIKNRENLIRHVVQDSVNLDHSKDKAPPISVKHSLYHILLFNLNANLTEKRTQTTKKRILTAKLGDKHTQNIIILLLLNVYEKQINYLLWAVELIMKNIFDFNARK